MTTITTPQPILGMYIPKRGKVFKTFIESVLKKLGVNGKCLETLTSDSSIAIYKSVFTSELFDEDFNYQFYEQLGDRSANKFITWYFYKRFPQLKCTKGVKVVARLIINYGAKKTFARFADDLGFWDFIAAPNDTRDRKKADLLEDVFEAFIGATEEIIDEAFRIGVGYNIVYSMLKVIFDAIPISLEYEDLYDAKTRLKELVDMYCNNGDFKKMPPIRYVHSTELSEDETTVQISHIVAMRGGTYATHPNGTVNVKKIIGGRPETIGEGKSNFKSDAEQIASAQALKLFAREGFIKHPPRIYRIFAQGNSDEKNGIDDEIPADDIDRMIPAKRTKYQSKYESTILARFCKKRDVRGVELCIRRGADANKKDTDGMSPLDLVFLCQGVKEKKKEIKAIVKLLIRGGCNLEMDREIYRKRFRLLKSEYLEKLNIRV